MHQIVQIHAMPGAQEVDILGRFKGLLPNRGCRDEMVKFYSSKTLSGGGGQKKSFFVILEGGHNKC